MKTTYSYNWEDIGVRAEMTVFTNGGVEEMHAMIHVSPRRDGFASQAVRLLSGAERLREEAKGAITVMKRYFLSDATNQQMLIADDRDCTVSYIQQPPMDGSKVALWMYMLRGEGISKTSGGMDSTIIEHNGYRHIWTMGMTDCEGDSYAQTNKLLQDYKALLANDNATIADNCIRTWFFVRDVDTNYGGLVKARREFFNDNGLSKDTHYIASTGIGGSPAETKALVQLGTYALTGMEASQQTYLYALTHLNKTIEYGVTFERATLMEYGDRSHIFISGTASINNKGEVMHVGDIEKQTLRMWENVEELLKEGGMSFADVMQIIVYIRDTADYEIVSEMFSKKFPDMPLVITLAPVCRPTWLIEMECIAVSEKKNVEFRNF